MTSQEKRTARRNPQRFLVRFEDAGVMRLAFSENISSAGMFLKTRFPPPPGTGLRLLIRTPQGGCTRRGVVMWARLNLKSPRRPRTGSGAGIRFIGQAPGGAGGSPRTPLPA